jgi:hypothetical protein
MLWLSLVVVREQGVMVVVAVLVDIVRLPLKS